MAGAETNHHLTALFFRLSHCGTLTDEATCVCFFFFIALVDFSVAVVVDVVAIFNCSWKCPWVRVIAVALGVCHSIPIVVKLNRAFVYKSIAIVVNSIVGFDGIWKDFTI